MNEHSRRKNVFAENDFGWLLVEWRGTCLRGNINGNLFVKSERLKADYGIIALLIKRKLKNGRKKK